MGAILSDPLIESSELRLLAEIGLLGISKDMAQDARPVFECLKALRPEQETGYVGLALAAMAENDAQGAYDILKSAPATDAVSAFKVLALKQSGQDKAARLNAEDLQQSASGSVFAEMAMEAAGGDAK